MERDGHNEEQEKQDKLQLLYLNGVGVHKTGKGDEEQNTAQRITS